VLPHGQGSTGSPSTCATKLQSTLVMHCSYALFVDCKHCGGREPYLRHRPRTCRACRAPWARQRAACSAAPWLPSGARSTPVANASIQCLNFGYLTVGHLVSCLVVYGWFAGRHSCSQILAPTSCPCMSTNTGCSADQNVSKTHLRRLGAALRGHLVQRRHDERARAHVCQACHIVLALCKGGSRRN